LYFTRSPPEKQGFEESLADMGIASPPAAARNVTVENFLPQQENFLSGRKFSTATRMAVGGGYFRSPIPEGKIHYLTLSVLPSTNIRSCATMGRNLERNMPSAPVKIAETCHWELKFSHPN
jgi:hypothetical protein